VNVSLEALNVRLEAAETSLLSSWAIALTRSASAADDLVQEVAMKTLRGVAELVGIDVAASPAG
jgi:DNA-directed RNA polymerase specialized sigma24 family protein